MITNFLEYIKEGVNDDVIVNSTALTFYGDNILIVISIHNPYRQHSENLKLQRILIKRIKNVFKIKKVYIGGDSCTIKFDNLKVNRILFYLNKILNFSYSNKYIKFTNMTMIEILNILKSLSRIDFDKEIDKYIESNPIDEIVINALSEEQKVKYKHLLQANNFDLI